MRRRRARPEDALRCLDLALREPMGSARRLQRLEQALLIYALGAYWPGAKTHDRRRGHARLTDADADAVATMQKLARDTGEQRPYTLAKIVAATLPSGGAQASTVIRRLVRAYCMQMDTSPIRIT